MFTMPDHSHLQVVATPKAPSGGAGKYRGSLVCLPDYTKELLLSVIFLSVFFLSVFSKSQFLMFLQYNISVYRPSSKDIRSVGI